MMKVFRILLVLISMTLFASQSIPAQAHSALKSSTPTNSEIIDLLPSVISLTFNEDLLSIEGEQVNTLALTGSDGTDYVLLQPTISGAVLSAQPADGDYPAGDYLLSYRVVSADGHPITGEIAFTTTSLTTIESMSATPVTTSAPVDEEDSSSIYPLVGLVILLAALFGIWRKRRSWLK
jgi:LPXTG-motif cell wall-anchored protein